MFRGLNLSVTWVLINNSSSDISLFFFSLYLQKSIIYVLEFLPLCRNSVYFTTKWRNKEKERVTSHPPLIHPKPPFRPFPPSQAACSEGSIPMTASTQTPPPLPPLKSGEYDSRTASDQNRDVLEKKPWKGWDPNYFRRSVTKYAWHLQDVLILIWHFTLHIEALIPYRWPEFFLSHPSAKFGTV